MFVAAVLLGDAPTGCRGAVSELANAHAMSNERLRLVVKYASIAQICSGVAAMALYGVRRSGKLHANRSRTFATN